MKFWNRLFRRRKKKKEELPDEADGAAYGLTEHETDLEDEQQRTGYVESLLTQIADAQKQISECEAEYAMVDLYLKDMELIDYISGEDREKLEDCAKAVHLLEEDKSRYEKKKRHMSDADYAKMERLSEDAHDSLTRLQEAEQYQEAIRNDLSRLENEKQACLFRRQEAKTAMENLRGMAVITTAAVFFCIVILLIMQFAFDSREPGNYLPYTYPHNSVVYTGTHDNVTTEGWRQSASPEDVHYACRYLRCLPEDLAEAMICACLASVSDMAIIPMADWLHLGAEARINTPSTQGANWQWRLDTPLTSLLAEHIADLTALYDRAPAAADR